MSARAPASAATVAIAAQTAHLGPGTAGARAAVVKLVAAVQAASVNGQPPRGASIWVLLQWRSLTAVPQCAPRVRVQPEKSVVPIWRTLANMSAAIGTGLAV